MLKVIGIGDNVVDVYLHTNTMYPGGNTMNFCAYARRLGIPAAYIGVFGDDRAAEHVYTTANHLGIELSHARKYHGENGWAKVDLVDGDRVFQGSNKGGVSKEYPIQLSDEDLAYIRNFNLIHTSCFSYVDDEIARMASANVPISYDFSDHTDKEQMKKVCPYLFLAVTSCGHLTEEEVLEKAKELHGFGAKMVLLSMGRRGAILYDGTTAFYQPSGKEKAIDSMGAGDSFCTAFSITYLTKVLYGENHEDAVKYSLEKAASFATEICMTDGAFGYGTNYQ